MRINGYLYPNFTNQQYKKGNAACNSANINFTGVRTIPNTFGVLSTATQENLKNLHENMNFIHDFFLKLARNPHKSIEIKNGYTDLIQKNRNSGISFNLPDNQGLLIIRRLLKNTNLMRFVLEKDGKTTNYLLDGYTKSVSNVNQKNPQLLPRTFKYMLLNEIKESNIEKYIDYANEKIQKYRTYLEKFNDEDKTEINSINVSIKARNAEKMRKYRAAKKEIKTIKSEINKSDLQKIMNLFQVNPDSLPPHIKPVISPSRSILGFSMQTDDGATLKISKKLNAKYGGNMAYLSFEKLFPNGEKSYMSIDLQTYKFLKMKDAGKPLIRNHSVFEYSQDEITKRNMVEKFESYVNAILKEEKKPETKPSPAPAQETKPAPVPVQETKPSPAPATQEVKPKEEIIENSGLNKLKENTIKKAIEDAKTLSDLYFKTFTEEFIKNITQKLNDFKVNIDTFLQNLWQK